MDILHFTQSVPGSSDRLDEPMINADQCHSFHKLLHIPAANLQDPYQMPHCKVGHDVT